MSNYVNLHCHSAFSIRDSCLKLSDLVSISKGYDLPAVCVSDHGSGHAWYKLFKEAKKQEIKPIIAQEFYYADDPTDKGDNYHIMVYAKNQIGYQNLCKLSSWAYLNGFFRKPRIGKEILFKYSEGLIVSTGCCFSKFGQLVVNNQIDEAVSEIQDFSRTFGDDFYLEVMDHGIEEEDIIRTWYRNYAQENNLKVIATNDTHYAKAEDREFHGIFKNIAYASGGEKDMSFLGSGFHILSPDEMSAKFLKNELDNTIEIADKCNVDFKFTGYKVPRFDIPDKNLDSFEYLKQKCLDGLKEKGLTSKKYLDRLDHELEQIHLSNLEDYVLIVADYCNWCKQNGIAVGPGRGSVGNSIMAIACSISDVDSIEYDLDFVRFTNRGRILTYDFGI